MDMNLKIQVDATTENLEKLSVWLESRGEVELAIALKEINKVIFAMRDEMNFLEKEIIKIEGELNDKSKKDDI